VEESELQRLQDTVLPKLKVALQNGLEERALPARKTAFVQELYATSLSDTLKAVGQRTFEAFLRPTFVPDEEATNQAREEAAAAVKPVEVKRGDVIVRQGEAVTQQQFELLSELDLVRSHRTDAMLDLGAALYLICLFAVFAAYLMLYRRRTVASRKHMLILSVMLALTVLLAFGLQALDGRITPSLIGVMLIALLVDGHIAMAANVLLAFYIGWMAGGQGSSLLGFDSVVMTASMLAGGQVAVYLLRGCEKRGTIITAGLFSGLAAALVIVSAYVMAGRSVGNILISVAWAVGSSVLSAVLVVGSLSLWENAFDVATSARLSELSNANHPLLRQLMTEAPGTYHHSMMTAALSESAAEAVDADPLLARVGAYYHDVGKLRRPLYFKENQKPGENIHDTLPPAESAAIILAHQKDGVLLLNKHKMPSAVVQIAFDITAPLWPPISTKKRCARTAADKFPKRISVTPARGPARKKARSCCWRIAARRR
jgi:putative nucleotidyltransferase with HDIG domain